jgi:hypothetical protein
VRPVGWRAGANQRLVVRGETRSSNPVCSSDESATNRGQTSNQTKSDAMRIADLTAVTETVTCFAATTVATAVAASWPAGDHTGTGWCCIRAAAVQARRAM